MRFLPLFLLILLCFSLFSLVVCEDSSPSSSSPPSPSSESVAATSSAAATEEKKPKVVEYSITEPQYCAACHAVIEEFYRFTLMNLHRNQMNITLGHNDLMEKYCKQTEPFNNVFHEFYMHGCLKIMQDHFNEALEPFLGSHYTAEYALMNKVYQHKIAACEKIDACRPDAEEKMKKEYSECERCEKVVWTAEKMIRRERSAILNDFRVRNYAKAVCREMNLHHRYPLDIEEYCNDIFEEYGEFAEDKFAEYFLSKEYLEANNKRPRVVAPWSPVDRELRNKVCVQLTGVCAKTPEEKKEHKEDIKRRREQLKKKQPKNPYRKQKEDL